MKALYIGILSDGTTSRSRFDSLRTVSEGNWEAVDTNTAFLATPRWARSLAFRLRIGPAVRGVNRAVVKAVATNRYDLIWVDKGVYLYSQTVDRLRDRTAKLVHYTPDTAFYCNRSRFFKATAGRYDLLITTKSFEQSLYERLVPAEQILLTTQSYDCHLLRPRCEYQDKRREAVFIGLCEADREDCIEHLLAAKIPVRIGGHGWSRFLKRHRRNSLLSFEGATVFGDRYADAISKATVGLGLLSKKFPELHTTRTFEIPACGTALATERNAETNTFFAQDEAIFYDDYPQLAERIASLWDQPELQQISNAGRHKVETGGFSTVAVMRQVLQHLSLV